MVARDYGGKYGQSIFKAALPPKQKHLPLIWAVEIAINEQWRFVCFEGDAKSVFDPLSSPELQPDWSISNIISNIRNLSRFFTSWLFVWVKRTCNAAAHATAKKNFPVLCYVSIRIVSLKSSCLFVRETIPLDLHL